MLVLLVSRSSQAAIYASWRYSNESMYCNKLYMVLRGLFEA